MDQGQAASPGAVPTTILEGQKPSDAWWSERKEQQVANMEQALERDLSNAMAGLREQYAYRQQPGDSPTGPDKVARADPRSDAAAMAEFRSEAAAARDEMLEGLARLRRELESQRLQSAPTPVGAPAAAPQSGGGGRLADLEALAARPMASLREDLQSLTRRVEALEAKALLPPAVTTSSALSAEVEAKLRGADAELAGALTAEVEQRCAEFRNVHRRLDELHSMLQAVLDRPASATPRAPLAFEAEVGMVLKEVSSQLSSQRLAQATLQAELSQQLLDSREQVSNDLTARTNLLVDAVRAELHQRMEAIAEECRTELYRVGQHVALVEEQAHARGPALAEEEQFGHYPMEQEHQAMPTQVAEGPYYVEGDPMAADGTWMQEASVAQPAASAELIPGDLKQGLEELVEKVHKTLNTCGDSSKLTSRSVGNSVTFSAGGQTGPAQVVVSSTAGSYVPEALALPATGPVVQTTTVTAPPRYVVSTPQLVVQTGAGTAPAGGSHGCSAKAPPAAVLVAPVAGTGSLAYPGTAPAAGDSRETFKKALEELRQENAALRACQDGVATAASLASAGAEEPQRSASLVFTVGQPAARLRQQRSPVRSVVIPQHTVVVGSASARVVSPSRAAPRRVHGSLVIQQPRSQ